jgi:DNA polymerase-3 subunit gamma/tau
MSEYLVTARKWRPMRFEDVAAQEHITTTLRNAIAADRLAHAYLFSGPRGVGKTTTARILARAVNCLHPVNSNPDNTCSLCSEILEGRSFDVLEIDGASNRGVEEIRNLRDSVRYAPSQGKYRVYIIDEVHMLTKEAFNALLKTLEEPPAHVLFIFATTEIHKVPATILSRCQRFDFRRIATADIAHNLRTIAAEEGITVEEEALLIIARKGDGSLRDAQSTFDQVVSLCGPAVTYAALIDALNIVDAELFFRVTTLVKDRDAGGALQLVDQLVSRGHDLREFLSGLTEHLRNLLVARTTGDAALIEASDVYRERYLEVAQSFGIPDLLRLIRQVSASEQAIRWSAQPRFRVEADLIQMVTSQTALEVGELLRQIEELKKKLSESPPPPSLTRPAPVHALPVSAPRAHSPLLRALGNPAVPAATAASPTREPSATLNPSEVTARWPEFVNEVRRQRISLGSVLESASLLGAEQGTIRISCANDFQASSIQRNREILTTILGQVFHVPARLDVQIHESPRQSEAETPTGAPPPAQTDEHPVIQAIIRELGAEPIH